MRSLSSQLHLKTTLTGYWMCWTLLHLRDTSAIVCIDSTLTMMTVFMWRISVVLEEISEKQWLLTISERISRDKMLTELKLRLGWAILTIESSTILWYSSRVWLRLRLKMWDLLLTCSSQNVGEVHKKLEKDQETYMLEMRFLQRDAPLTQIRKQKQSS